MNILFLTIGRISSITAASLYTDLLREFCAQGHQVTVASPVERRLRLTTSVKCEDNCKLISIRTGNMQKVSSLIEKGISVLLVERQFIHALKKYTKDTRFDLVVYTTPPVTFVRVVRYIKKRDAAKAYLLLKDIWPQGILDIGALSTHGWKGIIYRWFKQQEKNLYLISDQIGCLSPANVRYLLEHEPYLRADSIEVCPNSIEPKRVDKQRGTIAALRRKYDLPMNKVLFLYGGNLGRPQGIDFILACMRQCATLTDAHFLIVGSGTEYAKIETFMKQERPNHITLLPVLPHDEYEELVNACDVGLVFLDYRYTIPNFPSRSLSYMQAALPVLCATDVTCDAGYIAESNGFGLWCASNDSAAFCNCVTSLLDDTKRIAMGENAWRYLNEHYTVEKASRTILKHFTCGENIQDV